MSETVWVCANCKCEFNHSEIYKTIEDYVFSPRCPKCGSRSWIPKELFKPKGGSHE